MTHAQPRRVGIVGAGFMGTGIAEAVARAGIEVVLQEPETASLRRSGDRLAHSLDRAVEGGKLDAGEVDELVARVAWTDELEAIADCEVVIEAVVEDHTIKRRVFRQLDDVVSEDALLASNTSSIPIAELAASTSRPERVIGLHFFSPVPVMRLVEVVAALDTSEETVERAAAFATAIGKTPIRTKDRSGFIVNLLLVPYLMAAVRMYADGFASAEDIDEGMKLGCGHPMAPLALCDLIGLDVLYSACGALFDEFKRDEYAPPPLLKRMVVSGHLGRKTKRGFYSYEQKPALAGGLR